MLGAFLDAGQVDEIDVFVAPILEGGDHSYTGGQGRGVRVHERGSPAGSSGLQPALESISAFRGFSLVPGGPSQPAWAETTKTKATDAMRP